MLSSTSRHWSYDEKETDGKETLEDRKVKVKLVHSPPPLNPPPQLRLVVAEAAFQPQMPWYAYSDSYVYAAAWNENANAKEALHPYRHRHPSYSPPAPSPSPSLHPHRYQTLLELPTVTQSTLLQLPGLEVRHRRRHQCQFPS